MIQDSIFGVNAPKFTYDLGGASETEVLLDHWVPISLEPDPKKLVVESELETDREIIYRGEFLTFSGKIYLFKYDDPESKFDQIYQYLYKKVTLWEHRDSTPFKDKDGNPVLFYVDEINRSYLTTLTYRDVITIKFLSTKAVAHGTSRPIVAQLSELTMSKNL
jgi:hypothetical protein